MAEALMETFRAKILEKGTSSIKDLGKTFKKYDKDGNRRLSLEEFSQGVKDYGLDFSQPQCESLFKHIDKDNSNSISVDEFQTAIRCHLNPHRREMVLKAFTRADTSGDGILQPADLKSVFNYDQNPKYKSGEMTAEQIFAEFLKAYEPNESQRDGVVTKQEFLDYYAGESALIDNDNYFDMMIKFTWKL